MGNGPCSRSYHLRQGVNDEGDEQDLKHSQGQKGPLILRVIAHQVPGDQHDLDAEAKDQGQDN